ncbi:uncharacterized protein LOC114494619 [Phyllostomus discolor]|uniref:Uncharacterized protein LOC114494619 n=1 Tax=Phyllostomus discolor TaxID=89673 RepID=A0A7E6DHD0_9CHIR|nr:uncharacterized protein LOC114494619 [Phyllostomus discolor]
MDLEEQTENDLNMELCVIADCQVPGSGNNWLSLSQVSPLAHSWCAAALCEGGWEKMAPPLDRSLSLKQLVIVIMSSEVSFFYSSWCCLCAPSVQTWYLFCEAAAEETPALAMAIEKPKESTENNDHINLKVAGQGGSVVQFKIKRHTPLSKLKKAYYERQGLSVRQIRFRFDGQPINETDTPAQLEMEDEDTIDVFQQLMGGVY